jgi:hypothetical protein
MKSKLVIVFLIFNCYFVYSQKAPIKFGEINISDLEMKVYDKDTSAAAIVLCDYGCFNSKQFTFNRIIRIKILKKSGYDLANWVFPTSSKTDIKGITYNLEGGKIIEEKLSNKSIFEERVADDYYRMRVAMPNVKDGSIIDIEFYYIGFPLQWYFQKSIPIIWNELRLEPSPYVNFRKTFFGYEPLFIQTENRWVAKDMPAFKEEPYINSTENYITKFEFDILDISYPGVYKSFTNSWEAVSNYLYDHPNFGGVIEVVSIYLNNLAKEIKELNLPDEKKIEAAFNAIKKLKWNENYSIFTSSSNLGYVYKNEVGNSADINLMLLQLLKKLDIVAYPVILSTRENGVLSPIYPSLTKLNHVIVYAKVNSKVFLLDATEKYIPYNLLPEKCLNWKGRIITRENSLLVDLKADKKDKEIIFYNLELKDDLSLEGVLCIKRIDYAAFNFRKSFKSYNSTDDYLTDFKKNKTGLKIIDANFENIDSLGFPVTDIYKIRITDQINQIDSEFYFYPLFYDQIKDNPFKASERRYPVDFAYQCEKNIIITITLPKDYDLVSLPKPLQMQMKDDAASFIYQILIQDNKINIKCKFSINKEIFLPNEYADLKEFYNQIIKKQAEPIILKKVQ